MITTLRPAGLVLAACLAASAAAADTRKAGDVPRPGAALRVGVPAYGPPLAWRDSDNQPAGVLVALWRQAAGELGDLEVLLCGAPRDCRAELEAQLLDLAGPLPVGPTGALAYSQPVLSLTTSAATRRRDIPRDARALRRARVGLIDPFAGAPAPAGMAAGEGGAGTGGADRADGPGGGCSSAECGLLTPWGPERLVGLSPDAVPEVLAARVDLVVGARPLLLRATADGDASLQLFPLWRRWQYLAARADDGDRLQAAEAAMRRMDVAAIAGADDYAALFGDPPQDALLDDALVLTHAQKRFVDRHPALALGVFPLAPLGVTDGDQAEGLAVDTLRYHLRRIGVTPVFEAGDRAALVERTRSGDLDGLAYVFASAPPAALGPPEGSLPTRAIVRAPFVAAMAPGAPFVGAVEDLVDLEGVLRTDYARLESAVRERFPAMTLTSVASAHEALGTLLSGRADVWFDFLPVVRSTVLSDGSARAQAVRPLQTPLFDGIAPAFAAGRGLEPLVTLVNASIDSSGAALDAVQERWLATLAVTRDSGPPRGASLWLVLTLALAAGCLHLVRELLRERARLRRSDRALRRAQLLSGVGSLELPPPYDRVIFNGDTARLLGLPATTSGQPLQAHLELFRPEDAARLEDSLQATRRTGQASAVDLTSRDEPVRRYTYELTQAPATDTYRGSVLITLREVTERHAQEQRARALEREVLELQQLDALGRLAAGIAHDFNNALVVIISSAELGLRDAPPGHPAHETLQQILQAGLRSRDLVAQLLNSVRPPAQARSRLDLRAVVREELAMAEQTVPGDITLQTYYADRVVPVCGSKVQLTQVFSNLLRNAVDAMRADGGTLTVTVGRAASGAAEPRALLGVRDTGVGMDAATRDKVFDYFFSTRATGSGLGLAIVRNIVVAHGGAIEVETAPGEGAEFRVLLPLLEDAADGEQTGPPHLLVVDDDREILAALSSGLRAEGYRVTGCASPSAALAALDALATALPGPGEARAGGASVGAGCGSDGGPTAVAAASDVGPGAIAGEPDAILCDVTLPGTSGVELAGRFKRQRPAVPVVLLADGDQREALRACDAVDLVLDKRVDSARLCDALGRLLAQRG